MKKVENFSEWYNDIVEKANLCDKRYPVKGMNIWTPYGWKVMRLIDEMMREEMERTNHDEIYFPMLISEDQFAKEADHIKGFGDDVYWVTHAGQNPLDVKLLLRPTSETAMYPTFALWVRSHADLPLKIYQIVNVFRYETKQTRAFMRVREIHFFESHTCHTDFEDAERQIKQNLEIMENLSKKLCMPYLALQRPDWDKFAGAHYTIGVDALMPTGRTLQVGGIHQYKENFAVPYEIKYEDESGEHQYVHQTTYGMSERLVGAVVALHGDDKGLILPPEIAPFQVVIVPIPTKESRDETYDACRELETELKKTGLRVHLDMRELRPGNKFFDWEIKGVPLRLELGKRDMEKGVVTIVRRDTGEKAEVERAGLEAKVKATLGNIASNLLEKAKEKLKENITPAKTIEEARDVKGVAKINWCGEEPCGLEIEEQTDMNVLGTLADGETPDGNCIRCSKPGKIVTYLGRSY
jgi:prolyl-tRNA synthetase